MTLLRNFLLLGLYFGVLQSGVSRSLPTAVESLRVSNNMLVDGSGKPIFQKPLVGQIYNTSSDQRYILFCGAERIGRDLYPDETLYVFDVVSRMVINLNERFGKQLSGGSFSPTSDDIAAVSTDTLTAYVISLESHTIRAAQTVSGEHGLYLQPVWTQLGERVAFFSMREAKPRAPDDPASTLVFNKTINDFTHEQLQSEEFLAEAAENDDRRALTASSLSGAGQDLVLRLPYPNGREYDISRGYFTGHEAVDFRLKEGDQVVSVAAGTIHRVQYNHDVAGTNVRLHHVGNGVQYYSYYMHLSKVDAAIASGAATNGRVASGGKIGLSGATGNVTGEHLHLEIERVSPYGEVPSTPMRGLIKGTTRKEIHEFKTGEVYVAIDPTPDAVAVGDQTGVPVGGGKFSTTTADGATTTATSTSNGDVWFDRVVCGSHFVEGLRSTLLFRGFVNFLCPQNAATKTFHSASALASEDGVPFIPMQSTASGLQTRAEFTIGDTVEVFGTGNGLRARFPDPSSIDYEVMSDGATGTVLSGPEITGGYVRWKIRYSSMSRDAWSAEGEPSTGQMFLRRKAGDSDSKPSTAKNPSPTDDEVVEPGSITLSWDNGGGAEMFIIYFGQDSDPDSGELEGERTSTQFTTPTLRAGEEYFWRIDSVNSNGTTRGAVWSFRVEGSSSSSEPDITDGRKIINDGIDGGIGDGDGVADAGEKIRLELELKNTGSATAHDLVAYLSCSDPYVDITDQDIFVFEDIEPGESDIGGTAFDFLLAEDTPVGHRLWFTVRIKSDEGEWAESFSMETGDGTTNDDGGSPELVYGQSVIDDGLTRSTFGNGNRSLDPGDDVALAVALRNAGTGKATEVEAKLTSSDPYVSISDDDISFDAIGSGQTKMRSDFNFQVAASAPAGHNLRFNLEITSEEGVWHTTFDLVVGGGAAAPTSFPDISYITCFVHDGERGGDGDEDGRIDAGEEIDLDLVVRNAGDIAARDAQTVLMSSDPNVTIEDSNSNYTEFYLDPGKIYESTSDYDFTVSRSAVRGSTIPFTMLTTATEGQWRETMTLTVGSGSLISSDKIGIAPSFRNVHSGNLPNQKLHVFGNSNWNATTSAEWITVTSGAGIGPGIVSYAIAENLTDTARSGTISVNGLVHTISQRPAAAITLSRLANVSTRLRVETGDNVLIGGFIVTGSTQKRVIVRALGSSLPVDDRLANPLLELYNNGDLIASNDNWQEAPNAQEISNSTLPPSNELESALLLDVLPGAYTAIVRDVANGHGVGMVEVYDLDAGQGSKVANISTRGRVATGDGVMIGGVIVTGLSAQKVIVRAIGPSLPVEGKLEDPTLELYDGSGTLLQSNDNWRSDQEGEIISTTIPPNSEAESAIVRTLAPGNYTAVVRGSANSTGVALVEVYALQ